MVVAAAALVVMAVVVSAAALMLDVLVLDRRLLAEVRDVGVHRLAARLVAEEVLDLVVHVDDRLLPAAALVRLVDDVIAELGRHDVRHLALLHRERGLVELGDHHAATEPPERAALGARRTVGVLPRLLGEVGLVADYALADRLDLVERSVVRALDEDVLAEDLGFRYVLGLVRLVEGGDLLLGRVGDVRAGLVDEHVYADALLELLAERLLAHALRGERLLVVLLAADLLYDARDLGVDVLRGHGDFEPRRLVEEELRANRLVERLGLELGEVLHHLVHGHPVAHVEPDEPVELEVDGLSRYFLSVYDCSFHCEILSHISPPPAIADLNALRPLSS